MDVDKVCCSGWPAANRRLAQHSPYEGSEMLSLCLALFRSQHHLSIVNLMRFISSRSDSYIACWLHSIWDIQRRGRECNNGKNSVCVGNDIGSFIRMLFRNYDAIDAIYLYPIHQSRTSNEAPCIPPAMPAPNPKPQPAQLHALPQSTAPHSWKIVLCEE